MLGLVNLGTPWQGENGRGGHEWCGGGPRDQQIQKEKEREREARVSCLSARVRDESKNGGKYGQREPDKKQSYLLLVLRVVPRGPEDPELGNVVSV